MFNKGRLPNTTAKRKSPKTQRKSQRFGNQISPITQLLNIQSLQTVPFSLQGLDCKHRCRGCQCQTENIKGVAGKQQLADSQQQTTKCPSSYKLFKLIDTVIAICNKKLGQTKNQQCHWFPYLSPCDLIKSNSALSLRLYGMQYCLRFPAIVSYVAVLPEPLGLLFKFVCQKLTQLQNA